MRIGFAFNQKPLTGESTEDPPSRSSPADDRFAEWDDAETIAAVERALRRAGETIRLEANADFPAMLRDSAPDIVFNIAEGMDGPSREAHVPAICEFMGTPYTASGPLALCMAHDKRRAKEAFVAAGIATPPWRVIECDDAVPELPGSGPWIVKPLHEGSSRGISAASFCASEHQAIEQARVIRRCYVQPALVEAYLPGREFTVAVLGNGRTASALPPVEIRLDALPAGAPRIYGYEAKWLWDTPANQIEVFQCPADVDATLQTAIESAAVGAFHSLGCLDWARIDIRLDGDGAPNVLEVNPLPGVLPDPAQHSCFPTAARAAGFDYDGMIIAVLDHALARYGLTR